MDAVTCRFAAPKMKKFKRIYIYGFLQKKTTVSYDSVEYFNIKSQKIARDRFELSTSRV